jgi:hypothetical protein
MATGVYSDVEKQTQILIQPIIVWAIQDQIYK